MIRTHGPHSNHPTDCFGCHVRSLQIQSGSSLKPHYNWTVGQYVNNDLEYRDALKRCAERNSELTGVDHNYEPRYPGETKPFTESDYVLDDRAKVLRDNV